MPKAYWVAHVDVKDIDAYAAYIRANAAVFDEFGAKFIIRGGRQYQMEGTTRARTVVIEFKNMAMARACYESAGYQAAKALRAPCSFADLVIVEGYDD
ncbi:DUF1330 domain-containing protein [Roseinatronobacter alkalisoli]|uniref:DUF1330 domain-containing protein n=1 Tax=Roseinatronobacter alkalisoli TaxID=3028235 RepID=A0ABT5T5I5_9RHOB|nr:DUF1330 domain-containing protein [Roseinatronobacter sp. HJB301]MDD7970314.1 DUF1330 domain-containing protein [Roseinatronobacter sp. HJB301]